jgi:hypothetical protein
MESGSGSTQGSMNRVFKTSIDVAGLSGLSVRCSAYPPRAYAKILRRYIYFIFYILQVFQFTIPVQLRLKPEFRFHALERTETPERPETSVLLRAVHLFAKQDGVLMFVIRDFGAEARAAPQRCIETNSFGLRGIERI